jgi:hypothetical protein
MPDPRTGELTTTHYGWTIPTVGASADAWGGYINTDLQGIDTTVYNLSTNFSATAPVIDGSATAGVATTFARSDHVHPTDTTRAPIAGVTNASNAAAGQIGEFVTASQLSNVAMTTATPINITSISLTAGDWDVDGVAWMNASGNAASALNACCSTTSGTLTTPGTAGRVQYGPGAGNIGSIMLPTGRMRVNVSSTTTVYLVAGATFSTGTCNGQGTIQARRMR